MEPESKRARRREALEQAIAHERRRLEIIEGRDGEAGVLDFCRRILPVYRRAVLDDYARNEPYRTEMIGSYLVMKRRLAEAGA